MRLVRAQGLARMMNTRHAVAVVLVAVGLGVAIVPPTNTVDLGVAENGQPSTVSFRCVPPIGAIFGAGDSDGGWFAYAPNTGISYSAGRQRCLPQAKRRVVFAAALVLAGAVVWITGRRRRLLPTSGLHRS